MGKYGSMAAVSSASDMPASRAYSDCAAALVARGRSGLSAISGASSERMTCKNPRSTAAGARIAKVQSTSFGPSAVVNLLAQSCSGRCRHGLVCCPDHWLRSALCLRYRAALIVGTSRGSASQPTRQQSGLHVTEAFPWDGAPGYMVRDRDRIYGTVVTRRLGAMGIRDKPIAPASPWQNGVVERLIGSIRRECVDHIIVLGEAHLRRTLKSYARYYNETRTHLALDKDAPVSRPVQRIGVVRSLAILGGLHHHYARA